MGQPSAALCCLKATLPGGFCICTDGDMGHATTLILSITALLIALAKLLGALTGVVTAVVGLSKGLRTLVFGEREEWCARLKPKNASLKLR